ncbi:purine permease [Brevibacillus fluminis]|uniref:Purine permease n=1 Tax=Brevibacillus fluminis TaxID=511487 RepID=A0A3M8DPV4_9BACL|nr:purine/pyrimidine permease [Brevibacillus fluminis]RNB90004.1 purine permease [Brevibacillus fluminis]
MKNMFAALQWALFTLSGSIVVPVAIASTYGLDPADTVGFVQRTLFILGVTGILQALFGHRLPIQEGPAGIWWGIFSLYAGLGTVLFGSHNETLRVLEYAFLLSGALFIVLSLLGMVEKIARLFTPTIVGTYLLLVMIQLSGSFLKGMFGLEGDSQVVRWDVLVISLVIVVSSYLIKKMPRIGKYSVLISIVLGWSLFALFGLATPVTPVTDVFTLPGIFVFGVPRIEPSMIGMVMFATLLLLANMLATISVVTQVLGQENIPVDKNRLKQAGIFSGVNQFLGGIFAAIGAVPVSGSAGFIASTKITGRVPFVMGAGLIIVISLFPSITSFVAAMPEAVGYAAAFPIFANSIGLALKEFEAVENRSQLYQTVGISLFAGIGAMFVPATAFASLPSFFVSLLSNGLIIGIGIALILENVSKRSAKKFAKQRALQPQKRMNETYSIK